MMIANVIFLTNYIMARSSIGIGLQVFTLPRRVRLPYGLPNKIIGVITLGDFDLDRFRNESPSVDLDEDMKNEGELKELVEEVKEETPTEEPADQITPDGAYTVPDSLDPRINPPKEEEKDEPDEEESESTDEL